MKVLTIKQPWASLIINGYKEYEFRSWKTKIRGEILIHASKAIDKEKMNRFEQLNLDYPTGKILGKVTITDCIKVTKDFEDNLIAQNGLVYGASRGRDGYAFKLEQVEKWEMPKAAKGSLGFWNYDE